MGNSYIHSYKTEGSFKNIDETDDKMYEFNNM